MLSYQTHGYCVDCESVKDTLCTIDRKLNAIGKTHYAQITHLSSRKLDKQKTRDLIYYKHILQHLQFNPAYYNYNVLDIISKVKTLAL